MGALRVLLALSVVVGHLGFGGRLPLGVGGRVAVQAFFIVSGFYIALALNTSYANAPRRFWTNRLLRLYPAYLVTAVLAGAVAYAGTDIFADFAKLSVAARLWFAAVNVTLIGQDWTMFISLNDGWLHLSGDYHGSIPPIYSFLLVPPAWSLGLELSFYLLAPWLVKRASRFLAGIVFASIVSRCVLAYYGFYKDPWSYRFFPSELCFFVLGMLAFRSYEQNPKKTPSSVFSIAGVAAISLATVLYALVPGSEMLKGVAYLCALIVLLPWLFSATKDSSVDRQLGDLSYPIYISHYLVLNLVEHVVARERPLMFYPIAVSSCVVVAAVLMLGVEVPLKAVRRRIRERASASEPPRGRSGTPAAATP